MEHLLLKAATTATDEGTFTAVISTASVDRDRDIIEPAAMVASLAKWAALGKLVPLAWNHTDEVVGHIDPASAIVKDGEVIAHGWVDQSIPRGEEAWRLVKSGTLSFSFGFLFDPKMGATKLPNGRYRVKELDIFEISTIPVGPANNDTRVLSFKAVEEQREEAARVAREVEQHALPEVPEVVAEELDLADEIAQIKTELAETRKRLDEATREPAKDVKTLREEAQRAAREVEEQKLPDDVPRVKRLGSDVSGMLADAGSERFGGTSRYAYLDDYDPDAKWAVFCVRDDKMPSRYLQVEYTPDQDGAPVLGDAATEVVRTTSYRAANTGKTYTTSKELQERKSQLALMREELDALKKKAEEADKEPPKARSVDPLRKQAEAVALEFASDGRHLLKPPETVEQPKREPQLSLAELKQRMRDELLMHLSGEPL